MNVVRCERCGARNRTPKAASGVPRCGRCHSLLPWIVEATDQDFRRVVDGAEVPVLVDLWASWCRPCRTVSPILEQLAHEFAGHLKLVKVDVDRSPEVTQEFAVQAVPTLLVLNHGELLSLQAGAAPLATLRKWLESVLASVVAPS